MTTPTTIELFPGVQFRKDTTKPLGNQWMFEHEGSWLIAKLAYCDDISMDHLAKVMNERDQLAKAIRDPESVFINMKAGKIAKISLRSAIDLHGEVINGDDAQQLEIARLRDERSKLAQAIAEAGVESGHIEPGHYLSGPQLLMILGDMVTMLKMPDQDGERYRFIIDCPIRTMVALSRKANDPDFDLSTECDRLMLKVKGEPPADEVLVVPIAGTEVMTPIVRPWKEIAEPVADADRKCHQPDCWNCEGTGRDPNGFLCTVNDDFPF